MKCIKYKVLNGEDSLILLKVPYDEDVLKSIEADAYNGEYKIFDDGVEEIPVPTQLDRIEAQITYTAMMTDTLLED